MQEPGGSLGELRVAPTESHQKRALGPTRTRHGILPTTDTSLEGISPGTSTKSAVLSTP